MCERMCVLVWASERARAGGRVGASLSVVEPLHGIRVAGALLAGHPIACTCAAKLTAEDAAYQREAMRADELADRA